MSWSINAGGTKAQVTQAIEQQAANMPAPLVSAALALVALYPNNQVLTLETSGHIDSVDGGSGTLTIKGFPSS